MKISQIQSPNFGINFVNNHAFKEVEQYAKARKQDKKLREALAKLTMSEEGDVTITHGYKDNRHFSKFRLNNITVENTPYCDETYLDATLRCIYDLSNLDSRFKTLTGTNTIRTRTNK